MILPIMILQNLLMSKIMVGKIMKTTRNPDAQKRCVVQRGLRPGCIRSPLRGCSFWMSCVDTNDTRSVGRLDSGLVAIIITGSIRQESHDMPSFASRIQGPVAVIGDVHGQLEKLDVILAKLRRTPDFARRWIVFIGDLVDRGTDPKGVIDRMLALQREHPATTSIIGNHELAMAGALGLIPSPPYADWAIQWVQQYGVESTFESYGAPLGDLAALKENLPSEHIDFLANAPWLVEHPQAVFVHAGLDPNQPFELQLRILRQRDYTLNRPPWLCSKSYVENGVPHDCPVMVVSGHVPLPEVVYRPNRLLIDTTGGRDGDLSCVLLPELVLITSGEAPPQRLVSSEDDRPWWKFW